MDAGSDIIYEYTFCHISVYYYGILVREIMKYIILIGSRVYNASSYNIIVSIILSSSIWCAMLELLEDGESHHSIAQHAGIIQPRNEP